MQDSYALLKTQLLTITLRLDDLFQLHQCLLDRVTDLAQEVKWPVDTEDDDDFMEEDESASDTEVLDDGWPDDHTDALPTAKRPALSRS